jgi:hypothetical protein
MHFREPTVDVATPASIYYTPRRCSMERHNHASLRASCDTFSETGRPYPQSAGNFVKMRYLSTLGDSSAFASNAKMSDHRRLKYKRIAFLLCVSLTSE